MTRFAGSGLACALAAAVAGCGPMPSPLPQRFDDDGQKRVDRCWDRAFSPPDRFDHHELLDFMVGTQAFQLGVETFSLRAEKRLAAGAVVMEVSFDRSRPDDDRFSVTVLDRGGKVLRADRYARPEVDAAYKALSGNPGAPPDPARAASWARIREVLVEPPAADNPAPAAKR